MWATRPRPSQRLPPEGLPALVRLSSWPTLLPLRGRGSLRVSHDDPTPDNLQAVARSFIRGNVGRLIGKADFRRQDRQDLEQEVWTRLWARLRNYRKEKGQPHAFLAVAIERILVNLLRDRYAEKRDFRRVRSLLVKVRMDEGAVELAQTISQQEQDARQGRSPRSDTERSDLVQDVADVIARLSEDQQQLAEQLQHHSLAEIARQRGVPRSTLQSRVRKLREIFDHAGLRDYL